MTDHGYFEELICARLDGELSPEQTSELDAHLAVCGQCRAFSDAMAAVAGVSARHLPEPPADLTANVMSAVRAGTTNRKKDNILRFPTRTLAVAAAAALVLWAGARLTNVFRPKGASSADVPMLAASQVTEEAFPDTEVQFDAAEAETSGAAEAKTSGAAMGEAPAPAAPRAEAGGLLMGNAAPAPVPETAPEEAVPEEAAPEEKDAGEDLYLLYDADGVLLRDVPASLLPPELLVPGTPCELPDREADYTLVRQEDGSIYRLWEADGAMVVAAPDGTAGRTVTADAFRRLLEE